MTNIETDTKLAPTTTSYDNFPYADYSFSYACPEHLYTIAKIFGLNPVNVETAKVLELGCGSGGNIIGYAQRYPKANVVGVDLSKVQIDAGKKTVDQLGLSNIDLKSMSIADIDSSFGKFDYIICHGVFSWVPKEIQDKILDISKNLLSPNGIAYVSYNALPGWNIVGTFREMLQYHTDSFSSDVDKLSQARAFIGFLQEGLAESNTPYYKFLENEAKVISSVDNSYLKHEYLDRGNSQFYFVDFVKMAQDQGLSYLADTHLSTMYIGNLPPKAIEKLQAINDIVRVEQYMDFIVNRRFRSTLLCNNDAQIKRNIDNAILNDMWMSMRLQPDVLADKLDFKNNNLETSFSVQSAGGVVKCNPRGSFISAALYAFFEAASTYISMDDLVKYIKAKCPDFSEKEHLEIIKAELLSLLFKGMLSVRAVKPLTASKISSKPQISKLAQLQIKNNSHLVCNQLNDSVVIPAIYRVVMVNLDGKSDIDQLVKKVGESLEKSGQQIQVDGKTVTDEETRSKLIRDIINNTLQFCLSYAFLVG
jgi:methyltransferase-like protein/trans-aconitate methyltransferase